MAITGDNPGSYQEAIPDWVENPGDRLRERAVYAEVSRCNSPGVGFIEMLKNSVNAIGHLFYPGKINDPSP